VTFGRLCHAGTHNPADNCARAGQNGKYEINIAGCSARSILFHAGRLLRLRQCTAAARFSCARIVQAGSLHRVEHRRARVQPVVSGRPPPLQFCTTRLSNGFPVPDPTCTPGASNPTLTIEVLKDRRFSTSCVRDAATGQQEKAVTYDWYNLPHPSNNSGQNQICELDHLISLEMGGADTLDNVWPQCGPPGVLLPQRFFKEKDTVENFLAMLVREGRINLSDAQKGIATDWTQFLNEASRACPEGRCFSTR